MRRRRFLGKRTFTDFAMLIRPSHIIAVAAALVLAAPAAQAATPGAGLTQTMSAAKKKPRRRPAAGQIACTVTGCQRIPPQCHPEIEYDWNGIPTGFDTVVCPRRPR